MEQQQFKVSFSLGTKLLLSIVVLLVLVIGFLNISTIFILTEDKRAYVYQSQSTEAVLAGREFVTMARHSIDTLRLSLVSIDPNQPPNPKQATSLKEILDNQSDILFCSVSSLDFSNGQVTARASAGREDAMKSEGVTPQDFVLTQQSLGPVLAELKKNAYAFIDLTKPGGSPMVGILLADLHMKDTGKGIPVGLGVVSLREYANGLKGISLAVATTSGRLLYDSNLEELYKKASDSSDPLFMASRANTLSTGALEFVQNGERYLGSYVHPGFDLVVMNKTEWKKAIRAAYTLGEKFVLLGLIAVAAAVIFAILFSKTLTSPINRLYEATKEVAKGNFSLNLKPAAKDEIGALTSSFNQMSKKISELIQESMEKVHLENELAIASTVQATLMPPAHFQSEKILIESHYQAATTCGGDWWGFFGVGGKLVITIADATGHGFPSALITASARSCFSVMQKLAQEDPNFNFSPTSMLSFANRVIYEASLAQIMMTFFIGVVDFDTGKLSYASAGHNPPWLFKKDGDSYKLNSLVAEGKRLGESRDSTEFVEKEILISAGDVLFLYTDGLLEGKNLAGEQFGKKKAMKLIGSRVAMGPKTVIDDVMKVFLEHNEGKPLDDDVTIAVAKFL